MALFSAINANSDRRFQAFQHSRSQSFDTENRNPADLSVFASSSQVSSSGFDGLATPQGIKGDLHWAPPRDNSIAPASVLGRRQRSECVADWSPPTKARLTEFAESVASEYGISESQREELVTASALPTHKLIIVTFAALLRSQQADGTESLQTYLASAAFKENIVGQVRDLFLDPKLSSYKVGFLSRLLPCFTTAVSKAATSARSDLKRKMNTAWKKKTCIYDLVKNMAWKASQEMTDDIWARCAWLQMKLVDYQEQSLLTGDKREEYWDHIDKELAERRDLALEQPMDVRAAFTSFVFEEALKAHLRLCPPTVKNKRKSSARLPLWQVAISRAVAEMEAYSQEELADEEEDSGVDGDVDGDDVDAGH
ncbi:hypothetical protein B0H10DRAFT_2136741 [Mycena sp. CBHHK59/15]|nr:hypothetical protein B0H10DRAFT_2136741 [Mycena sp. CBHHK59/15]